jgi:hypothetical protein
VKTDASYSNTLESKALFEKDILFAQMMSEVIYYNLFSGDATSYSTNDYKLNILEFLSNTFVDVLPYFTNSTTTNYYDAESRFLMERRIIYTLGNMLNDDLDFANWLSDLLSIAETVMYDYTLFSLEGIEQESLRQTIIKLAKTISKKVLAETTGTT